MLSKKVFWEWFKKEVEPRWKQHRFEWVEVGDWHWRLQDFDIDTLTQAVRRHKVCECYPIPNLKKIYEYAKKIEADKHPNRHESARPQEHTFIMCVAKSDNGCGPVGKFVPILLWPFKKQWTQADYVTVAKEQCIIHSRSGRNGVWKPFYNTTHGQMLTRSCTLLGTKPLDLNELRKRYKNKS